MPNYAEAYFSLVERLIGRREDGIAEVGTTVAGLPKVFVLYFSNWPAQGVLTAITLGVGTAPHQDELGHAELIVSVKSLDRRWGFAAGVLGEECRGKIALASGSTLNLGEPFSDESAMEAFILTAPHQWSELKCPVRVADRDVFILEAHPIYRDELTASRHCSRDEISNALFGPTYDVKRKPLSLGR